jgi:hypothetical protein
VIEKACRKDAAQSSNRKPGGFFQNLLRELAIQPFQTHHMAGHMFHLLCSFRFAGQYKDF